MLFTRAVICALLKMDQEIVETTTVLLAGLILSDWFESQMPHWCLNNCKGRKFYCVTIHLLPVFWPPDSKHVTQSTHETNEDCT
jgi:hypothetical protein